MNVFTRDSVSPICKVAALETQEPSRKKPRSDNVDPRLAALQMETEEPKRA